jgi:Uma2 family endonuclease
MVVQEQLVTVEAFEQFIARPENRDRLFELIDGEIVEKMPTRLHGVIAGILVTEINLCVRRNNLGTYAAVEARHRPANDDKNDRLPDVSYVADAGKPIEAQGAALYMPDLCVEIKSPDDTFTELRQKAAFYIANGARLVWLIYPEQRCVEVYQPNADSMLLTERDTLTGGDVLPGFSLPVRDLFPA